MRNPSRFHAVEVGDVTFYLRRPNKPECSDLYEFLDRSMERNNVRDNPKLSESLMSTDTDEMVALAIVICAREEVGQAEPFLDEEDALEWAYEAMIHDECNNIQHSQLAMECLRLCGLGSFTGKGRG